MATRWLRFILVLVGIVFLFVIVGALILFFATPLHKSLFVWVLERDPGTTVQVEHVRFGWNHAEVEDLYVLQGQNGIRLEAGSIDISYMDALLRERIEIRAASVSNLFIDISGPALASSEDDADDEPQDPVTQDEAQEALEEWLDSIRDFDWELAIADLAVEGEVLMPGKDRAKFVISAERIRPGESGELMFQAHWLESRRPVGSSAGADMEGTIQLSQKTDGGFTNVVGEAVIRSSGSLVRQGDLRGQFSFELNTESGNSAAVLVADGNVSLATLDDGRTMSANLTLHLDGQGKAQISMPMRWVLDEEYSVSTEGIAHLFEWPRRFSMTSRSELLDIEELTAFFTDLFGLGGEPAPPEDEPTAPGQPLWFGWTGEYRFQVEQARHTSHEIGSIDGTVVVDDNAVTYDGLSFDYRSIPVDVGGALQFHRDRSSPYELIVQFETPEFDIADAIRGPEDDDPTVLEGLFVIQGSVHADTIDLGRLAEAAWRGEFGGQGRNGVIRPIPQSDARVRTGLGVANLAAQLLGGGGDGGTSSITDLVNVFKEIAFEQMVISGARGDSLDVELREISIFGSGVEMHGQGSISYQADTSIMEQPLNASLQIAVAEGSPIESGFRRLGLLMGDRTESGLLLGPQFRLTGSLANTQSNLMEILTGALARGLSAAE